jgi:hypothetical protein
MNASRFCRLVAVPAVLVVGGCATVGHPCFSERVMFPDKSAACQYGRAYRCDNGDWIAERESCTSPAPELAAATALPGSCDFAGISFASGSASCNAGIQYRCDNGRWASLGRPCAAADAPLHVLPHGSACTYQGATVPSSSAICQSGTTFVCNDGQWINLGTLCG